VRECRYHVKYYILKNNFKPKLYLDCFSSFPVIFDFLNVSRLSTGIKLQGLFLKRIKKMGPQGHTVLRAYHCFKEALFMCK
jgi:hypothetical protein